MKLNPHHLELFYCVVRNAGVSQAARQMSYGIGRSAVSRQLGLLESQLGVTLCERRPFKLTEPGKTLFALIQPFFDELPGLVEMLRCGVPDLVRLGASHVVLREYVPSMVRTLREKFPNLRFTLCEGLQTQLQEWLRDKEIDVAVTLLEGVPPADCLAEPLLRLPMILLVPPGSKVKSAAELWRLEKINEPLICPTPENPINRRFLGELNRMRVQWPVSVEANSFELVEAYVRDGLGFGVSLAVPGRALGKGLRALALPGFPEVELGMIWRREPSAAARELMEELRRQAERLR